MKHSEEAAYELVVAGHDGTINPEPTEGALDVVAQIEKLIAVVGPLLAVSSTRNSRRDAASDEIIADDVAVVAIIGDQCAGRTDRQRHQRVVDLSVRRFTLDEVEAERSAGGGAPT